MFHADQSGRDILGRNQPANSGYLTIPPATWSETMMAFDMTPAFSSK